MKTTVDIPTHSAYSVADTRANNPALFGPVSAECAFRNIGGGCKKLVTRVARNNF